MNNYPQNGLGSSAPAGLIDSSSSSRYVLVGVGVVMGLVVLCALTFFVLSQALGRQEVLPTRAPGSTARVEPNGPLIAGAAFSVRGLGFQPGEAVEILAAPAVGFSSSALQKLGQTFAGPDGSFQKDDLIAPGAGGQYYLTARGSSSGFARLTPVTVSEQSASLPTPSPTPEEPLPDLVVEGVTIELESGSSCAYVSTQLGIRVVVRNIGPAPAGPFLIQVNNQQQLVPNGLLPGEVAVKWFAGYASGPNLVIADPTGLVKDRQRDNNQFNAPLPIPTLPATCTPPPPSNTPAPTSTPNPNPSRGWYVQYFGNPDLVPPVLLDQNLAGPFLNVNWGTSAPGPGVPRNNWSAIFNAEVLFPSTDNYQFILTVDGGVRVFVDEQLIINQWFSSGLRTVTADVALTAGQHNVRLEYYKASPAARLALSWRVNYSGWEARYYNTPNLTGPVIVKRDDPPSPPNPPGFLNTAAFASWPPPGVNPFNFSVDWRRRVDFAVAGSYIFTMTVDDGARLLIDGQIVPGMDDFSVGPKTLVGARALSAGPHSFQVQYANYTGPASLNLVWALVTPPATPTLTPTPVTPTPTSTATPSPTATPTLTPTPVTPNTDLNSDTLANGYALTHPHVHTDLSHSIKLAHPFCINGEAGDIARRCGERDVEGQRCVGRERCFAEREIAITDHAPLSIVEGHEQTHLASCFGGSIGDLAGDAELGRIKTAGHARDRQRHD